MARPDVRIGISGWVYEGWRGVFYPDDLPQREELHYASCKLNSLEVNGTFYSLKKPQTFEQWRDQVEPDTVFAVKGSRFITHTRRLSEPRTPLSNFFAQGVLKLGSMLGPFLWQLPPTLGWDRDLIDRFFTALPATTDEAARLARDHHDDATADRLDVELDANHRLRHAIEVRHESFMNRAFMNQCREHGVAFVIADTADEHPHSEDVTAGFVYCRLHGDEQMYVSGYDDAALDGWAERIRTWSTGGMPAEANVVSDAKPPPRQVRDVYVYFDNDVKVRAPFDAMNLAAKLGVGRDRHHPADSS